jgi:hypothetical protein
MIMSQQRRRWLVSLELLVAVSIATALPLCALSFRCGCTMMHGERECNVHDRFGPHCPWCEGGAKAFLPGYVAAMAGAVLVTAGGLRRRERAMWMVVVCGVGVYLMLMLLGTLVTAKVMHYPIWMGWRIG